MDIIEKIAPVAKAVYGGLAATASAFLSALLPYLTDGNTLGNIPAEGWIVATIAGLALGGGTGALVYNVPNKGSAE